MLASFLGFNLEDCGFVYIRQTSHAVDADFRFGSAAPPAVTGGGHASFTYKLIFIFLSVQRSSNIIEYIRTARDFKVKCALNSVEMSLKKEADAAIGLAPS